MVLNSIKNPTHTVRNVSNSNARLGKYAGGQSRWFTGDLGSLICYERELPSIELNQVLAYLSILYKISVSEVA